LTGPAAGTRRALLLRRPGTSRRGQEMASDGDRRRFRSLLSRAQLRAWILDNKLFAIVLAVGFLLRVDTELGYQWQMWFNDSFTYMSDVIPLRPDVTRPAGYAIFLKALEPLHSYAPVTILQHLMGLAVGVMVYALARHRFGAPRWIAALATLPVLFDGFQIELEHLILSDVPFEFLIMLATTLLLWDRKPTWKRAALIGLILGVAETVRSIALPLLPIFLIYILLLRIGWKAFFSALIACLTPVLLYCTWFYAVFGQFAMTESTGVFLYSRTMAFADCNKIPNLPADELSLCITTPPSQRPISQEYIWENYSPLDRFPPSKFSSLPNHLAEDFAKRAILAQPLDYAQIVAYDTIRVFEWKRYVYPNAQTYNEYLFGYKSQPIPGWAHGDVGSYTSPVAYYIHGNPLTDVVEPFAGGMRVWQRYVFLPGTVYGAILAVGLFGMVLNWRRVGGPATVPWLISVALIVAPAATAEFDYRYVLPAVPFACLAAAMAFGKNTRMGNWVAAKEAARAARKAGAGGTAAGSDAEPPAGPKGQELTPGESTAL